MPQGVVSWLAPPHCWTKPIRWLGGRLLRGWSHEHDGEHASRAPPQRGAAGGRARHAARALLRPRLRARHHAVHRANGGASDLGGPRAGRPRAGDALVGVGRIRVADERGRPGGGQRSSRDLRGDGRVARGRSVRAPRLRRRRARVPHAYAIVRVAQIALFNVASRDDPQLRHSIITGLVGSTAIGAGLLITASFTDGALQLGLWALALVLDMSGPLFFGVEGWKLVPGHFAERHGLIVLIALGESIVAIGVGADHSVDAGVIAAAVLGTIVAATLWWMYFDVVALVAARRLARASVGREQNALARDAYSFLHLPMIVGIVLVALGMKKTLAHVEDPLKVVACFALLGGVAIYLLAHVGFRYRGGHTLSRRRLSTALL